MHYSFKFTSYFPLHKISALSPNYIKNNVEIENKHKKYIKQSYLLFTWFYYINLFDKKKKLINFFTLPITKYHFTLTKAPIAHKTWSKEQYGYKTYNFVISFKNITFEHAFSLNEFLFIIHSFTKTYQHNETNLFFLKSLRFYFKITDNNYFNFSRFLIINK